MRDGIISGLSVKKSGRMHQGYQDVLLVRDLSSGTWRDSRGNRRQPISGSKGVFL